MCRLYVRSILYIQLHDGDVEYEMISVRAGFGLICLAQDEDLL